jgi:hypothetical protein
MNRRNLLKSLIAIPLMQKAAFAGKPNNWLILGRRLLEPNTQAAAFALKSEIAGIMMIGIEVKDNSVWLYDLQLAGFTGMSNAQPIVLKDSSTAVGCLPHVSARRTGEGPSVVELNIECLPCTNRPIEILIWGTA